MSKCSCQSWQLCFHVTPYHTSILSYPLSQATHLKLLSSVVQETNSVIIHFSPFYNILKQHSLAVFQAVINSASQAENPVEFLLSKQGKKLLWSTSVWIRVKNIILVFIIVMCITCVYLIRYKRIQCVHVIVFLDIMRACIYILSHFSENVMDKRFVAN